MDSFVSFSYPETSLRIDYKPKKMISRHETFKLSIETKVIIFILPISLFTNKFLYLGTVLI